MILLDILEEHLEEADFLFQQRENALADRVYNMNDLAEIEERLLAHLDGLDSGHPGLRYSSTGVGQVHKCQ